MACTIGRRAMSLITGDRCAPRSAVSLYQGEVGADRRGTRAWCPLPAKGHDLGRSRQFDRKRALADMVSNGVIELVRNTPAMLAGDDQAVRKAVDDQADRLGRTHDRSSRAPVACEF